MPCWSSLSPLRLLPCSALSAAVGAASNGAALMSIGRRWVHAPAPLYPAAAVPAHVAAKSRRKSRDSMHPYPKTVTSRAAASAAVPAVASPAAAASVAPSSWSTEEPVWSSHPTDRALRRQLGRFRHLRAAHAGDAGSAPAAAFEPAVAVTPEGLRDLSARTLDSVLRVPLSAAGLLAVVSPPAPHAQRASAPHDFLSPPVLSQVVELNAASLSTLGDACWNRAVSSLLERYHPQMSPAQKHVGMERLRSNNLLYIIAQRVGLSRLCYATLHTHYTSHGTRALTPAAASHLQSWSTRMTLLRPLADNVLSDTLESLVGLVLLERGSTCALHFVECLLGSNLLRDPHSVPLADLLSKNAGTRPKRFRLDSPLPKPISRPQTQATTGRTTPEAHATAATTTADEHISRNK